MHYVHTFLMMDIITWMGRAFEDQSFGISIYPTMAVQPVDNARNEIVEEFMKSDCTHLLFIDADTIPPPDAIQKLLAADKEIISGITPIVEYDEKRKGNDSNGFYKKWNCVDMKQKYVTPNSGTVPIKSCGSSCILIKREVFEKIEKPYYRFLYQDDNGKEILVSEDVHFIVKAAGKGIQAYADTSVICGHFKPVLWK